MISRWYHLLVIVLIFSTRPSQGQIIVIDTAKPSFEWVIPLIDIPFMKYAAQAEANHRLNQGEGLSANIEMKDYGRFYRNLSMSQNTEMARNLHGTFYYGHNMLWYKLVKPTTTRRYILNRILANVTAAATDYLLIKSPYGFAYQHEEFHRSVMITRGIYSYDEVWEFGKGFDIAVTHVTDEDLIYLKNRYPADMVRLMSAGVEAEYAYIRRIREDNFFESMNLPAVGITILGTIHAVSYVNLPFASRFNEITDSILSHDKNDILARDFTGYDFSAWVYDLFRPDEPYESRGQWPDGIGIKRPIKETDLTPEMKSFLREAGNMQYLNIVSPFIIGINKIRLGDRLYANFAFRSVPTSFGYYAGGDFFLDIHERKMLVSLGVNRSNNLSLPSIEFTYYHFKPSPMRRISVNLKTAVWMQPEDQLFFADKSSAGMFIGLEPKYEISRHLSLYADFSYKTKGWMFANPFLDDKFVFRFGVSLRT